MNAPHADLLLAQQWIARLNGQSSGMPPAETALPPKWIDAIAHLIGLMLAQGKRIQIVVPDDETLPELSNAIDIDLRPLCLVLPEAAFATRIALRATLTLLKSRLARRADTHPVWDAQRLHIDRLVGLWQASLQWAQNEADVPWPAEIGHLFPVRLLPASHAIALNAPTDVQILIAPERMQAEWRDTLSLAAQVLCLSASARGAEKRQVVLFNEETRDRFELDLLSREIAELELELATAQAEIADFTQRYYAAVGSLMVELDALQAEIDTLRSAQKPEDAELQQAAETAQAKAEQSHQEQKRFEEIPRAQTEKVFAPSRDLKKLYRQIAQKIHPDRANNEEDRSWRTQLMSEATRAYRNEDESALREVLSLWEEGATGRLPGETTQTEHAQHGATTSQTSRSKSVLADQLKRMRARLAQIQGELDRLLGSRLYELFVATRMASRQGRNLLQEMARQIELQIDGAKLRLSELRSIESNRESNTR